MSATTALDRLAAEIAGWPGVTTGPGRFGAVTFRYGTREIGHVHGNSHADLPFPTKLRHELVAAGKAEPHHFLPQSGWVSASLRRDGGEARALDLFRLNYDLILRKKQPPEPMSEG
jgi:Family of unknown function (DUF5519)